MRNIFFLIPLIIFSILTFNAIGQDTTYFDYKWKETISTNAIYYRIDIKTENGFKRTDYISSKKQIQMQGEYISSDPDIKTGEFKWYHTNGELKHIGSYSENKEIGTHIWYFDDGKIEVIENYVSGVLNGEYKEFHKNKKPLLETSFTEGKQNGFTRYFRKNGSLHSQGQFKNGNRDGIWNYYDEQGESLGKSVFKMEYTIEEADMFLKLPNNEWKLTEKKIDNIIQYYFKRKAIIDKNGKNIIPAIMVFVEDASDYNQDVTLYSATKRIPFMKKGTIIEEVLIQDSENYPLTYKNAYFIKCSYTSNGLEHVFYMIHIINEQNKGIQIYLDMTKDIAADYETEFWETIKSIREI